MARMLPNNLEAEMSVLGVCFINGRDVDKVVEDLHVDMFFDERNKILFNAIKTLHDEKIPIDVTTLKNELDIITLNIQKSSQNLNQPDIFYAGLFSQLLFKGTSNENLKQNIENNKNNEKEPSIKLDDNNSEEISD